MRKWSECLTDDAKYQYHAEVYAWRRVRGFASVDEKTSPVDPEGRWFDEYLVRQAAAALQAKQRRQPSFTFTDEELEERREWARLKGYASWESFLDAVEAGTASILPFLGWANARREERGPPQVGTFVRIGAALAPRAAAPIEGLPPPPPRRDPIHQTHTELGVSVSEAAE